MLASVTPRARLDVASRPRPDYGLEDDQYERANSDLVRWARRHGDGEPAGAAVASAGERAPTCERHDYVSRAYPMVENH